MTYETNQGIKLDEKKLRKLQHEIYSLERANLKMKPPLGYSQMVERIRKAIEEEVKKCY